MEPPKSGKATAASLSVVANFITPKAHELHNAAEAAKKETCNGNHAADAQKNNDDLSSRATE